jgi:hypothetical protein
MSVNFWFEDVIDAYLAACARGDDWQQACAAAQAGAGDKPRRVLTVQDLKAKGICYSRQHIGRRVKANTFPAPFQLPGTSMLNAKG